MTKTTFLISIISGIVVFAFSAYKASITAKETNTLIDWKYPFWYGLGMAVMVVIIGLVGE